MDMDINSVRITERTVQCRNLSNKKTNHLFFTYIIQIFEVYNITRLRKLVGLYFSVFQDN